MYLIQLLLPIVRTADSSTSGTYSTLRAELIERFGGVTAYTRSPASGAWVEEGDRVVHDEVIIVEVMTEQIDRAWWRALKARLESELDQQSIVIRSSNIEML